MKMGLGSKKSRHASNQKEHPLKVEMDCDDTDASLNPPMQ